MDWPAFSSSDSPLDQLVKLSRFYGSDPEMVIAGGGNTSLKTEDRLWVKGSGLLLANITREGFVEMNRAALDHLLTRQLSSDRMEREAQFKDYVMAARCAPEKGQRPSIEVLLHHVMPGKFVVHTHCTLVNMFTCCVKGEEILRARLGDEFIYVEDVDPGFPVASMLREALRAYAKRTGRDCPRAVIMQSHGLVVCGDTPQQAKIDTDWVMARLTPIMAALAGVPAFGTSRPRDEVFARQQSYVIGSALRGLFALPGKPGFVTFDQSASVLELVCGAEGSAVASRGALWADQIVYCRNMPMWFEPAAGEAAAQTSRRLREGVMAHEKATGFPPAIVLVKSVGMFAVGESENAANAARLVYADAAKLMAGAGRLGGIRYLSAEFRAFIENWEVESYRKSVSLSKGG